MPITPVADETQPQAQPVAQPQVTPTPDPAHVILSAAQTDDKTKADAWEIYHNHEGKEFEDKLAATSLPQDAKSALWQAKTRAATTAQQATKPTPAPQQDAVEKFLDKAAKTNEDTIIPGAVKGAYQGAKGLYHGVMGDEETAAAKGAPTGTAGSPNNPSGVSNYGVTPGNVGYNVGKMGRGIYEFGKGLVQDIAGTTPVAVPDEKGVSIADPTAHTLLAKYVTAPSDAERKASQKEMEEYFKTKGPEATGHAISAFLHGTLGEYVPAIGPLVMSLTEQAQKGDIGGALSQIGALYAFEKGTGAVKEGLKERVNAKVSELSKTPEVKQAEANVDALGKARDAAQAKLDAAKARHQAYTASHEQGIGSPEKIANEVKKAQDVYDEAEAHHEIAKEDLAKKQAESTIPKQVGGAVGRAVGKVLPTPAPEPEAPITAAPALKAPGPAPKIPQIGVSPAHATTTIPQEPTPAPRPAYGRIELAGGQGTMGTPKQLTAGENPPTGATDLNAVAEATEAKQKGVPQIKLPEPTPKPVTDEGALRDLKATKGEVVESPEKKVGRLLQEALKPAEKAPEYKGEERRETERKPLMSPVEIEEAMKNRKPVHTPFDVTQGAMETIKRDQAMPKHPAEEAAVKEQPVLPKEEPTGDIGAQAREANPEPPRAETKGRKVPSEVAWDKPTGEYKGKVDEEAIRENTAIPPDEEIVSIKKDYVPLDKLKSRGLEKPYDYTKLKGSVEKGGIPPVQVILDNEGSYHLGDGSHRVQEWKDQGMTHAPAWVVETKPKAEPVLPKEEPTGYAAKKEEVVPVGAEGREPVKSAAEYSPAVEQKVNELSDANLRKLAQAHGLEPNEYDLNARDERRHRVERDQLAKDIIQQMGEDEKINLGRAAASAEREGLFQGADTSAKGRAARAEKMFPRLRGPVDENGNPKISGGAPDTVGTKEAADRDNEHFANAKKELGPNASISDVAKRAQELKDAAAKPKFDMVKDADGKPDRLEITHKGEPKGHLKIEEQVPGTWTIKDAAVKPGEQRQGLGKAALEQTLIEAKQAGAKAVESDISHTTKAKGMWEAVQKNHPDAVTEENGQYSVELAKLGKKKSPYGEITKGK